MFLEVDTSNNYYLDCMACGNLVEKEKPMSRADAGNGGILNPEYGRGWHQIPKWEHNKQSKWVRRVKK